MGPHIQQITNVNALCDQNSSKHSGGEKGTVLIPGSSEFNEIMINTVVKTSTMEYKSTNKGHLNKLCKKREVFWIKFYSTVRGCSGYMQEEKI